MYSLVLLFVYLAIMLDIRMLNSMDEMAGHIRWALKFRALSQIFAIETFMVEYQASFERAQSESFQAQARQYFEISELDKQREGQADSEAKKYEDLSEEEQAEADAMYDKVRQEEILRIEIQKNLTRDEQIESEVQEKLKSMNQGLCAYEVAGWLCDLVGGTVELKREADQETLQIQQEMEYLQNVKQHEYLDQLVANALQGNATAYNQTASELLETANYWDKKARDDANLAAQMNATSIELMNLTQILDERGRKEEKYRESELYFSEKELGMALASYAVATRRASAAVFFAVLALAFLIPRLASRLIAATRSAYTSLCATSDLDFGRRLCAAILHIFVFFVAAGACGSLVSRIEEYGWRERAAIVFWFASVAGLMQTLVVQTLPHALAEWPPQGRDVLVVAKYSAMRFVSLALLYAIEFLVVCTSFPALISSDVTGFFGSPVIVLVFLSKCALYLYVFEPKGYNQDCGASMTSTLATVDDFSRSLSEATPLTAPDEASYSKASLTGPGSTAAELLNMDLGPEGRRVDNPPSEQSYSLDSRSPYFVDRSKEVRYLAIAFDVLLTSAVVGVLADCLPLVYKRNPGRILVPLSFSAILGVIALLAFFCSTSSRRTCGMYRKSRHPTDRHIEIVSV
jgi:hypothetical protein